jgi:hypothetical protein
MRARLRLRKGTYQRPNRPIVTPVAHVQIHQRTSAGSSLRTASSTTSASAQPIVMVAVT